MSSLPFDERFLNVALDSIRSEGQDRSIPMPPSSCRLQRRDRYRTSTIPKDSRCVGYVNRDMLSASSSVLQRKQLSKRVVAPEDLPPLPFQTCGRNCGDRAGTNKPEDIPKAVSFHNVAPMIKKSVSFRHDQECSSSLRPPTPSILPNYALGQEGRQRDMVIYSTPEASQRATDLLSAYDAAFVRRSDGRWVYAVVEEKVAPNDAGGQCKLRFVVDADGSTKTLPYHRWGTSVRMIRAPEVFRK